MLDAPMNCSRAATRWAFFIFSVFLIAGCATRSEQSGSDSPECDISSLKPSDYNRDTWCVIKTAAARCSTKSDKCLIQCERSGGAKQIGGGCSHVCLGGGGVYTDADIAENGGSFYPPEALICINGK